METEVRPALVLDVGGLGDQSFNDSAYAGLQRAKKELNVDTEYLESQRPDRLRGQPHPARRHRGTPPCSPSGSS